MIDPLQRDLLHHFGAFRAFGWSDAGKVAKIITVGYQHPSTYSYVCYRVDSAVGGHSMKVLSLSILAGVFVTVALVVASHLAFGVGLHKLSYVLYWQGFAAAQLVPCSPVDTPGRPFCMSVPSSVIAFFSGIPVGFVLYSYLVYRVLRNRTRAAQQGFSS